MVKVHPERHRKFAFGVEFGASDEANPILAPASDVAFEAFVARTGEFNVDAFLFDGRRDKGSWQLPSIIEPMFQRLGASVVVTPAMNGEDPERGTKEANL